MIHSLIVRSIVSGLVLVMSLGPVKRAKAQGQPQAQGQSQAPSRGWIGVAMTTGIGQSNGAGQLEFSDYPVVESVDPGSPAEKAGIQAGDILISLNAQDLRRNPIPGTALLQPGQKINFRYRRNEDTRTVVIVVAERPRGTTGHYTFSLIGPAPARGREAVRGERSTEVALRERAAERAFTERVFVPNPSMVPLILGPGAPSIRVAGAEMTMLNEGLREALNVTGNGVFVVNVALGTPAGEAGLKSGDVIIRAEKFSLQNPGELVRLMREATENTVLLHVLRKKKEHTVRLRW